MKRKLIKAYHQVGGDDRTPAERREFMRRILEDGFIKPAVDRVKRSEMEGECFGDAQGSQDIPSLSTSAESLAALTEMAREWLARLPVEGTTHTMFNCMDLLAGDFGKVFLSVGDWYSYPNGFVFDAEELLRAGASYRPRDLLGYYRFKIEAAAALTYDSAEDARRELEEIFDSIREAHETTGLEAVRVLEADCVPGGCPGEIVWPGSLPLGLAIGMWREGKRVKFREGARA